MENNRFKVTEELKGVTKEAWEAATPNFTNHGIGRIIVFGTGGGMTDEDYVGTFMKPDGYNLISKSE